ncbi:sigma-54-dependent Fis family transcriptional regulator [Hyphomicrobium sp.]|uniref:sigma-54-dependent Fis family transcriptional regulator n=1 Tax=Hyphomicrobium sp. TaxID=82 RepID=UPI0025C571B0|nr:sigma-54-dependent Fis family transcriptional regulator [Hyphomicrobium sp.]MCC7253973.1 sigma-54-dependent Fis family transcriptional regulator [Hyphomicrobium sp.]
MNIHKLNPTSRHQAHVETAKGLSRVRDQLGEFGTIARTCMEKLAQGSFECGYVILTNAEGVIVDFVGHKSWMQEATDASLMAGANWSEDITGTNGIGTCIVEQGPVSCHLDEHFHVTQTGFSCGSAPLYAPDGSFLGVLNVSTIPSPGEHGESTAARVWASQFASLIDSATFIQHFKNYWVLKLARASELVDVSTDLLIAVDADGVVVGANMGARRLLDVASGVPQISNPTGKHLTTLFRCGYGDIWQMMKPQSSVEPTLLRTLDNTTLFVSASPPREARASVRTGKTQLPEYPALSQIASDDKEMKRVLDHARRLVNKNVNILIQGETGTGKEVLAKALHDSSARAKKAFVAVNCAAIPESLIESELFGYTAGTFTGARSKGMQGLIERSSGGTLFLDEIGDMPLHLQTRLLRVLSEREVLPLGADSHVRIDLTVISASHRDLRKLVSDGIFREDLYYRLCGATLVLPPLRDRQDKEYIIHRVLQQEAKQLGCRAWIDEAAMALLVRYPWPGNVRELRNAIRFALAISDDGIFVDQLPPELRGERAPPVVSHAFAVSGPYPVSDAHSGMREPAERLRDCLRRNKWNITAVSAELGLCRTSVYRQMKRFGIIPPTHL